MVTKRKTLVGAWGRYEYRAADPDWDPYCDTARACNDEVDAKAMRRRSTDFDLRMNILKAAVLRVDAAWLGTAV